MMAPRDPDDFTGLLWVDDDQRLLRAIRRDYPGAHTEATPEEAIVKLKAAALVGQPYAVLVADYLMPTLNGIELCAQSRLYSPTTRRVIVSAIGQFLDAEAVVNVAGASHVFTKPPDAEILRQVLVELLAKQPTGSLPRMVAVVPPERVENAVRTHQHAMSELRQCTAPFLERRSDPPH